MASKYNPLGNASMDIGGSDTRLNVSIKDLETLECGCGNNVFSEGTMIKVVSALLTGTGKEGIIPIPVFFCSKCHVLVERFLPEELKSKKINLVK
jgi:hypothetical protein